MQLTGTVADTIAVDSIAADSDPFRSGIPLIGLKKPSNTHSSLQSHIASVTTS